MFQSRGDDKVDHRGDEQHVEDRGRQQPGFVCHQMPNLGFVKLLSNHGQPEHINAQKDGKGNKESLDVFHFSSFNSPSRSQ